MPLAFLGRQNSRIPPSQEKRALCTSFKYHQQSPLDMEAEYFVSVNIYLQNNKKRSKCEWPCHPSNYTYCRVAFILQEYKISTLCVIAHSDNGFEQNSKRSMHQEKGIWNILTHNLCIFALLFVCFGRILYYQLHSQSIRPSYCSTLALENNQL